MKKLFQNRRSLADWKMETKLNGQEIGFGELGKRKSGSKSKLKKVERGKSVTNSNIIKDSKDVK